MNWSEEVERDNEYGELPSLPAPVEEFDKEKGLKIVTEYRYDSNDKKVTYLENLVEVFQRGSYEMNGPYVINFKALKGYFVHLSIELWAALPRLCPAHNQRNGGNSEV